MSSWGVLQTFLQREKISQCMINARYTSIFLLHIFLWLDQPIRYDTIVDYLQYFTSCVFLYFHLDSKHHFRYLIRTDVTVVIWAPGPGPGRPVLTVTNPLFSLLRPSFPSRLYLSFKNDVTSLQCWHPQASQAMYTTCGLIQ